jgi:hypothetical protein
MKLTIKHLAPYLPYELKILNGWGDIKTLKYTHLDDEGNGFIRHVKPILRHLSELTKEIEHNGENFVFSNVYLSNVKIKQIIGEEYSTFNNFLNDVDYNSIQLLFKYHFDVFGLIDAGLAIDINTLDL